MIKIKLNATQRKLLEKALGNSRGVLVVSHGFRTGCRDSYGSRDSKTFCQLRDLGLIAGVKVNSGRAYYGGGECDHYTEASATITDAGRAALS